MQRDSWRYHSQHNYHGFIPGDFRRFTGGQAYDTQGCKPHLSEEFLSEIPKKCKVKPAKKVSLAQYKYSTCYKYNEESGRYLRYYVCDYDGCGRLFNKTWTFLDHVRIHTGEKPFTCDICQRGFAQKGNLNKHKKLHLE